MRFGRYIAAGCVLAAAAGLLSGCAKKSGGPLVGVYLALTGSTATFGETTRDGIQLAADEVNAAGGINGQRLELAIEDDRGLPQEARTVVTKLIQQQGAIAILGDVASSNSMAAAPVCQMNRIPMISPSSTNPDVTKKGDYIYRVCFIDTFQGYVVSTFVTKNLHAKKAAILWDNSADYSTGLHEVFKNEFQKSGGQIVQDVTYHAGDADFSSQLTRIRGASPDVIFVPGYYTEVSLIARQARQLGITVPLCGCDGWTSPNLIANAGTALEGCYFSDHYSPESKAPEVHHFLTAFRKKYGHDPNSLAALGYDAAKIMAAAMIRAKSLDPVKIKEEIARTQEYRGVTGDITINADRNAVKPAVILQIHGDQFRYVTTIQPPR